MKVYIGLIKEVKNNLATVAVEGQGESFETKFARLVFPYYGVREFDSESASAEEERLGHGYLYKPAKNSFCLLLKMSERDMLSGRDARRNDGDQTFIETYYVIGFLPPSNSLETYKDPEIVQGPEDPDVEFSATDLVNNLRNDADANTGLGAPRNINFGHNDEDFTEGDMGLVSEANSKVINYSFGACLIAATDFCFRLYSKKGHKITEAFKSREVITPSGAEAWTNDKDDGSNYIFSLKHNFEDDFPIYQRMVGELVSGFYEKHSAKEGEGTITKTIGLDLAFNKIYDLLGGGGGLGPVASESVSRFGRDVDAFIHNFTGQLKAAISSLETSVTGSTRLSLSGLLTSLNAGGMLNIKGNKTAIESSSTMSIKSGGPMVIKGSTIDLLAPAESAQVTEEKPDSKSVKAAEEAAPEDALGNVNKAAEEATAELQDKVEDVKQGVVDKVNEVKEKIGENVKKITDKTIAKIGPAVTSKFGKVPGAAAVKSKVKDKLASKIQDMATEKGFGAAWTAATQQRFDGIVDAYAPADFQKVVNNSAAPGIQKFLGDNITNDEALGAVSSDGGKTFLESTMGPLAKNHIKPLMESKIAGMTQDQVDDSTAEDAADKTFNKHFNAKSPTALERGYSDNTASMVT